MFISVFIIYFIICCGTFISNYSLKYSIFGSELLLAVSSIVLCKTFEAPSGWMGNVSPHPFINIRNVQSNSNIKYINE